MAKELLPGQELGGGRYEVVKTLTFGEDGGVYTVRDRETRKILLLKEIIPPASMADEELQRRAELFTETLLILTHFDHPNLSKIYLHFSEGRRQYVVMERVEGVTLHTLMEMSVKPLPEPQVVRWAMDLCDALHYMHDRPQPFIFDVLEPTHIMMTTDETLKLINYGIDRFFLEEEAVGFTASREQLAQEMKRFGETLVFLLTRKPPGPYGLMGDEGFSEELTKVLNRLLLGDPQRTFTSYEELKKGFDRVLNPPAKTVKMDRGPQKPWVRLLDFGRMWEDALWAYLRQPLWLVLVEIFGAIGLGMLIWYLTHPPVHPRQGPAAYVACGREISVIQAEEKTVQSRIMLEHPVTSVAATPDGEKLFAAAPDFGRLYVLNTLSNRILGVIQVERGPRQLIMGPLGQFLYVLHPESGQVGFVQVSTEKLPLEPQDNFRPQDAMVGVFAAGPEVGGLAAYQPTASPSPSVSPTSGAEAPAAPAVEAASPTPSPTGSQRVYVSSRLGNRMTAFEPSPLNIVGQTDIDAPGPVAITTDHQTVLVGQGNTSHILTFRADTLEPGPKILQVGGAEIRQLLTSPDGKELWSVNGSGSLGVINLEDRKLRSTVTLPGTPSAAAWRMDGKDLELWVTLSSASKVVVVNPLSRTVQQQISVGGAPSDVWVVP